MEFVSVKKKNNKKKIIKKKVVLGFLGFKFSNFQIVLLLHTALPRVVQLGKEGRNRS